MVNSNKQTIQKSKTFMKTDKNRIGIRKVSEKKEIINNNKTQNNPKNKEPVNKKLIDIKKEQQEKEIYHDNKSNCDKKETGSGICKP